LAHGALVFGQSVGGQCSRCICIDNCHLIIPLVDVTII
jgi:hypothetical protein